MVSFAELTRHCVTLFHPGTASELCAVRTVFPAKREVSDARHPSKHVIVDDDRNCRPDSAWRGPELRHLSCPQAALAAAEDARHGVRARQIARACIRRIKPAAGWFP